MAYLIDYAENDTLTSESTTDASTKQVSLQPTGKMQPGKTYFMLATAVVNFPTGTGRNKVILYNENTLESRELVFRMRDQTNEERSAHAVWAFTIPNSPTISDYEDFSLYHGPTG